MEGEAGGKRRARHAVAVIVLLCCLAPSFTCFSLRGLRKTVKQDNGGTEVAADVKTGSIAFNGKVFNFQSGSASPAAAPGNDELLHVDLYQSDGTEMLELENDLSNEAEWGHLNYSLHCGLNKMKLKFMGLGATDLQLHMGDAPPLPLTQVPKTCGYSMQQNELGLDLVVSYYGCHVIKENGRYVLQMRWQETPVKFACPMLPNPDLTPASTALEPMQMPLKVPFSHRPSSLRRSKRQIAQPPSIYDPNFRSFLYYMSMLSNPNSTPELPPYYWYYLNYLYYLYYFNPNNPYCPFPATPPATTTVGPVTTTSAPTPAPPTTRKCSRKTTEYPGQILRDTAFENLPFPVQISPRSGKFPDRRNYMTEEFYESGFQDPALSGFHWQPIPWFPASD